MKLLVNLVLVVGFCLGTVGAAGFHPPVDPEHAAERPEATTEKGAWLLFGSGLGLVFAGGLLERNRRKAVVAQEATGGGGLVARSRELVDTLRDRVVALDEEKATLSSEEVRARIDALLAGEYFDLTSRNEELAGLLGFEDYARVWEGVATAERLLARTWSMATDGFLEQGLTEIPRARQQLEHAAAMFSSV